MKKPLLILSLLGLLLTETLTGSAQGLCDLKGGGFVLDRYEGCAPLTVTITNTTGEQGTFYAIDYDGQTLNPSYYSDELKKVDYPGAGNYTILQTLISGGSKKYHCETVKVYQTLGIVATQSSCGGGNIKLALEDGRVLQAYDYVEISWGDGVKEIWNKGNSFTLEHKYVNTATSPIIGIKGMYNAGTACKEGAVNNVPVIFQQPQLNSIQLKSIEMRGNGNLEVIYEGVTGISTDFLSSSDGVNYAVGGTRTSGGSDLLYRIPNLSASQIYQVKLSSKDLCGGKIDSEVATSMVLKGTSADEKNSISWNKYPTSADFQEYSLLRDGVVIKTYTDINITSFEDEDVQCGDNYEYSLVAKTKTIISTSAPLLIKTTTVSPKSVEQGFVTVKANDLIELTAIIPGSGSKTNYDLTIERSVGGNSNFKKINTLFSETVFTDFDVKADNNTYCYRITYQNACGQKSVPSQPVCSILLQNQAPLLVWTTEKPFIADVDSYTMIQTGSSGSNEEKNQKLAGNYYPNLNGQSDPEYTFQIRADSRGGNFQSFSNIISYKRDADILYPDAFSPNGDGINDVFEVKAAMYKTFKMSVLNRWGKVIFHSGDTAKGWDGMIKGREAPVGS